MFNDFVLANTTSISLRKLTLYAIITINVLGAIPSVILDQSTENAARLLEVKIYYESLCPYSQRFIRNKFYPAMINNKFFNYTDIKFIAFGKITPKKDPKTNEDFFTCQHGLEECELNSLHDCIVENNNKMEQLQMINCLLGDDKVEKCSSFLNINVDAALHCKVSRSIENILKPYGDDTHSTGLLYVPTVAFDGIIDMNEQENIVQDFVGVFCRKYKQKYNVTLETCSL